VGWHDLTAELRGPVVSDVAEYFALRWQALTGERLEPSAKPAPRGAHRVQFAITNPRSSTLIFREEASAFWRPTCARYVQPSA